MSIIIFIIMSIIIFIIMSIIIFIIMSIYKSYPINHKFAPSTAKRRVRVG